MSKWIEHDHAVGYLSAEAKIPQRVEGEQMLLDVLPQEVRRVLDLGCGDGRLLALVLQARPQAAGTGMDFSPAMLRGARERFAGTANVTIVEHNLDRPLPKAKNHRYGGPRGRRPTARRWPPWPRCSRVPSGFVPLSR